MAVAGVQLSINADELRNLAANIRSFFPPREAADVLGDIIERAIWPAYLRLREVTPVGPTGNLKRAVNYKIVKYKQNGVALGLIGYNRAGRETFGSAAGGSVKAGKDRAFHQWFVEFGTRQRTVNKFSDKPYMRRSPTAPYSRTRNGRTEIVRGRGVLHEVSGQNAYIASSFNRLGPFTFVKSENGRVQTDPKYPAAFFKKSKNPIVIPAMPAGGKDGQPPVQTAFDQTQGQVAEYLQRELSITLGQAWGALQFRSAGSVSGTDSLGPS